MKERPLYEGGCCCRRGFLQTVGATAGTVAALSVGAIAAEGEKKSAAPREKKPARVRGAFIYPPSDTLRQGGYWSWPGSTFDAEGHQKQYMERIKEIEKKFGMQIVMDPKPLGPADVARFIDEVKKSKPDGLLLIPFYKGYWGDVTSIVEEAGIPSVVFATIYTTFVTHIHALYRKPGVYVISSRDNLDAVEYGMRMINVARWMKDARILNVAGSAVTDGLVPHLGTEVHTAPRDRFMEEVNRVGVTEEVKKLADAYLKGAKDVVEPAKADILDAAQAYYALKRLIAAASADAMMMQCLGGLRKPPGQDAAHIPVCMAFMSLRDEGIAAGCEADLPATLTMMLLQELFDKPGFQHNPVVDTEKNQYFGAHCTCASKLNGVGTPSLPYILRSHNEAGWGCVPQVLMTPGEEFTMAKYIVGEPPKMYVYSGTIVGCTPKAESGCRTNVETTINELADACDVKGHHLSLIYGNHAKRLRAFCQLHGIEVVT